MCMRATRGSTPNPCSPLYRDPSPRPCRAIDAFSLLWVSSPFLPAGRLMTASPPMSSTSSLRETSKRWRQGWRARAWRQRGAATS